MSHIKFSQGDNTVEKKHVHIKHMTLIIFKHIFYDNNYFAYKQIPENYIIKHYIIEFDGVRGMVKFSVALHSRKL